MVTAEEHKSVMEHALHLVGDPADGTGIIEKMFKANGIQNIFDIVNLQRSVVSTFTYKESNKKIELPKGHQTLLVILAHFNKFKRKDGASFKAIDWLAVDQDEFNTFRLDYDENDYTPSTSASPVASLSAKSAPTVDPVREFKRGIKRDPTLFPELKDLKQWDAWCIETKAQAKAQNVEQVFDAKYKASSASDKELFEQKQKFMYAVFTKKLLTDKGKSLVREHDTDGDAQTIYRQLFMHAKRSTKASVDASELLAYITTSRLGTGLWKGSTESFIIHWQSQIRKYEGIVDVNDCFSDSVKRTMLENAVKPIDDLRAVKDQANQFQVRMGTKITYDQYCSLLLSAAQSYDSQFETRTNSKGIRRSVYSHDIADNNDFVYNIDSDPLVLQANMSNVSSNKLDNLQQLDNLYSLEAYYSQANNRPRLPKSKWDKLSDNAKRAWIALDIESKRIILGTDASSTTHQDGAIQRQGSTRRVQFHATHDDQGITDDNNTDTDKFYDASSGPNNDDTSPSDDAILAHMTQRKQLPPGHLHRVLSSTQSDSKTSSAAPSTNEVTIDGKLYREVNMAKVRYCHSHSRTRRGALVDRGANGGICGNDVRIINKTGRMVDVQGIDNHQVVDVPIVTGGAVAYTQRGPVILILNQYAYIGNGKTIHSCGQMEMYGHDVNDKSMKVRGGQQRITTPDGFCIPLNIKKGLPYMTLRPYTDDEWNNLPHVVLTGDTDWDPSVLDNEIDDNEHWFDAVSDFTDGDSNQLFDLQGNYRHRHVVHRIDINSPHLEDGILPTCPQFFDVYDAEITNTERDITPKEPKYSSYIPNFAWQSAEVVKRTFEATTQYIRLPVSTHLTQHFKSPFPALNVNRRKESAVSEAN